MPRCHPETRKKILENVWSWSTQNDPTTSILWLRGPAGAGKSAIAQTFCQRLSDEGRLGASFFFKRGHPSRGNARKLIATIAYQLAMLFPDFKDLVSQIIFKDPSILDRSLATQLQALIFGPCLVKTNKAELAVVVIDGLDECDGKGVQKELLRSIGDGFHGQVTPLRFLIASRPEPHIRETFETPSFQVICRNLNIEQAFADVRRYLNDEFGRIHHQHRETMGIVPTPWPTFDDVEKLVEKSSGYFIYAATIIKFIDDEDFRPTDRLAQVMHWQSIPSEDDSPFEALDQLYTQILCCVPTRSRRSRLVDILCTVVHFGFLSVANIETLLELQPGDVALTLRRVQSLLSVPSDTTQRIIVYHASLVDFLHDTPRSGEFCVSNTRQRMNLGRFVLKALSCESTPTSITLRPFWEWSQGTLPGPSIQSRSSPYRLAWCVEHPSSSRFSDTDSL
ncbi:hypothetical protein GGX14DRAFT_527473 [Mycena pura]|uniref:Nephrocystin 3-like N-terminal domain-containing protein n=1 Tax=Mycena pura TaxID=153505 RepID=A0AAD6UXN4_9AGAR|nr:hypothetical protein GGX14DRAFT_527473 [Mycena pura]